MTKESPISQSAWQYFEKKVMEIWDNLVKNNLWKRILKNALATTILGDICFLQSDLVRH